MAQRPSLSAKTGNANIVKMGHTTDGKHGSDPSFKPSNDNVRDLSVQGQGK